MAGHLPSWKKNLVIVGLCLYTAFAVWMDHRAFVHSGPIPGYGWSPRWTSVGIIAWIMFLFPVGRKK